tara:strand:- start:79733 stop:82123 length:2391 start_codon:yes stop_codon:yes gene_type:complete
MSKINLKTQPRQRLAYSAKTKEWRKENIDNADKYSFYHNESVRRSLSHKIRNINLYNGILDVRDMANVVNPHGLDASYVPDNIPHNPIIVPKIDLLVGEEIKRRFDWSVIVTNPDAITEKENSKKKVLFERLTSYLQENYSDEELDSKFAELESYMKYDWQDLKEKLGNQILKHYWEEQNFGEIFNKAFKDALIFGEQLCQVDIVHNEPILSKLNPLKVHAIRSGNSDKIEDSSIIIIEDHWSPGKIVDYFYDELKPSDIDNIMEGNTSGKSGDYSDDDNNHVLLRDGLYPSNDILDEYISIAEINGHTFSKDYTDADGNVRVLRVYWKSLKKVKKVKYYDEFGDEQSKIMSEEYILDSTKGEESKDLWINEWWEGTKIGKEIYVGMKPRRVQYNKLNNPSYCHPGIIGQIYNTNQGKPVSLVDRTINYQYMYDAIFDRLNKSIATNYGKIANIDLAGIPNGWEIEKWLHFAVVNKIAFRDSFKEGNQGAATGKLAGSFNNGQSSSIDMETGNYIQQHIQLLEFIKLEMGEIAGVTRQREGQVSTNETLGGVERSVNQSAYITEMWFYQHEQWKLRVLNAFLETAKIALKGNNKKAQYILDDQTIELLNIDSEEGWNVDFGVVAASSSKAIELEQAIKQYAQAFLQNGGSLSTIMDIYFSPSLSDMRKKLELAEEKINQNNQKSQEDANKLAQQAQADAKELELTKLELEDIQNKRDNDTKIYIAELSKIVDNDDGIEEPTEDPIGETKLKLDIQKQKDEKLLKIKDLNDKMTMHNDKMQKEDKKIAVSRIKKTSK